MSEKKKLTPEQLQVIQTDLDACKAAAAAKAVADLRVAESTEEVREVTEQLNADSAVQAQATADEQAADNKLLMDVTTMVNPT